jgi:chromosome segregation ATPase
MRWISTLFLTLILRSIPAAAQAVPADSQMGQTMLAEIRSLREDLLSTAAITQRVQIAIYRLHVQSAVLEKATQRLDQARGTCEQAQEQQRATASGIEEMKKTNAQGGVEPKAAEQMLAQLQSTQAMWADRAQQCQGEQADAENQFRNEQAKMNDLEAQLERLDQALSDNRRK